MRSTYCQHRFGAEAHVAHELLRCAPKPNTKVNTPSAFARGNSSANRSDARTNLAHHSDERPLWDEQLRVRLKLRAAKAKRQPNTPSPPPAEQTNARERQVNGTFRISRNACARANQCAGVSASDRACTHTYHSAWAVTALRLLDLRIGRA